jgi:hypothetical protein
MDALAFRAIRAGLLTSGKIKPFLEALDEEIKISEDMSVHTFHAGFTRMIRNDNLFSIASATPRLKTFCDNEVKALTEAKPEPKGMFSRFKKFVGRS